MEDIIDSDRPATSPSISPFTTPTPAPRNRRKIIDESEEEYPTSPSTLAVSAHTPPVNAVNGGNSMTWVRDFGKKFGVRCHGYSRGSEKNSSLRYPARCNLCLEEMDSRAEFLERHATVTCTARSHESVAQYRKLVYKTDMDIGTGQTTSPSAQPEAKKVKTQHVITSFFSSPLSNADDIHTHLLHALIEGNISFRFVGMPSFHKFLGALNPAYVCPNRQALSGRIMLRSFGMAESANRNLLGSSKDLTLALDGWEDVCRNSIYAFMALKNKEAHLLDMWKCRRDPLLITSE